MRCTAFAGALTALGIGIGIIVGATSSFAQERITTPPVVASIWDYAGTIHAITAGVDLDYDEQQDEGDEPASWLIIDPATRSVVKSLQFPWADITAKHLGFDPYLGVLYIALDDTVWAYTAMTQQRSATPVFTGSNITSVSYNLSNGTICVSHRPSYTDPGYISIVDPASGTTREVDVDVNPQMIDMARVGSLALPIVLCEGTFGKADGSLVFLDAEGTTTSLVVGDTPNDVVVDDERGLAYVVMTGSHEVVVVDIPSRRIVHRFSTPTSGYDGPRELALADHYAFVTTYDNRVLVFDRGMAGVEPSAQLVYELNVGDKCDPIAVAYDHLWVGISYVNAGYDPAPDILVFPLGAVSVEEITSRVLPEVISNGVVTLDPSWGSAVSAVDVHGASVSLHVQQHQADVSTLAPGVYGLSDGRHRRTILVP